MDEDTIEMLKDSMNLEEQIKLVLHLLQTLNQYCDEFKPDTRKEQGLFAQQSIANVLSNYPFESEVQRQNIRIDPKHDFELSVPPLFLNTLLGDFLNALFSQKKAPVGVHIECSVEERFNVIHIKCNPIEGIENRMHKLRESFICETQNRIKLGFGLCQLAIRHAGGDVIFQKKEDGISLLQIKLMSRINRAF
jgi:hypothetical protein